MDLRDQLQTSLGNTYTVGRELAGGMSRVFVAEDASLGRRVVVKVLPSDLSGSVSVSRFRREIALAARLQHPHIVPLLSTGEVDGLPYYTMPFVEGDSLRARLTHGELPIPETISVLRDVARALEYAHAKGVTHRDIKPDNVLLAGTSAVITDFGVAKALNAARRGVERPEGASPKDLSETALTSVGIALGTPAYMAPEQAAGDPATDHRADIYAFGMMAYEMLAGHVPFAGRTAQAMLAAHAVETPVSIATLRLATPSWLAELVMRCIEKRPADRPQTATEIVHALDGASITHDGTIPVRMTPATTAQSRSSGARMIVAGVVAVGVVAIAAAGLWRARAHGADDEIRSIAVLPFDNTTRDTAYDYLEDGITDRVRDALNATLGLTVKARSSSRQLKANAAREVGAKLGVDAVLFGTVKPSSSGLYVTTELVRVSDESALWSGTFDGGPNDIAALQDTIVRAIVAKLGLHARAVSPRQPGAGLARPTSDGVAYDLFLRGRFAYDRFDYPRAEALFRAALVRDPRFARAEGFLAMTQANGPVLGLASLDSALALTRATAEHALSLDSTVVEAYIAESFILASDMRFVEAIKPLETAMAFDSTNADLISNYALALAQVGRIAEGLVQARRARDRDPLYASAVGILAYLLGLSRDFQEAIVDGQAALDLSPSILGYRALGFYYAFAGKRDSSLVAFQKAFALDSTMFGGRSNLVFGYAVAGRWNEAERQRALIERRSGGNSPDYYALLVSLSFDDYGAAMTALERGVANREPLFSNLSIPCDPLFDPLKSNPRFTMLMQRLGARACPESGAWPIPTQRR